MSSRSFLARNVFIVVSLMLLLADGMFVALNYWHSRESLQTRLEEEGERLHTAFEIALKMTYSNMSQLATFVAEDPKVRQIFSQAVDAVRREGGGPGGAEADVLRKHLYDTVAPSWHKMTAQYSVRQLHFHLGPGSTSFLRVHKPEKFGDNMDQLRHMVVDVNRDEQPRTGLELGRVYSGLRGIVPVYSGESVPRHLGALEAGTSFRAIIKLLSETINADIAVLLREKRVEDATWQRPDDAMESDCGCFVEASSSDTLGPLLAYSDFSAYRSGPGAFSTHTALVETGTHTYALTHFGMQDYIGARDGATEPVGRVLIWHNADALLRELASDTRTNIVYAVVGYILIELILFFGIRATKGHLNRQIRHRTAEIRQLNQMLHDQATTDELTGLKNRRYLMTRLGEEYARADSEGEPLSVLMLDIDYFKKINDSYGHAAGDQALEAFGRYLSGCCRRDDVVARYGGEEFCIVLPNTPEAKALLFADRLRSEVEQQVGFTAPDGKARSVTCSVGVCDNRQSRSADNLIDLADSALYAAKQRGRNRVEAYVPDTGRRAG
ncbi:MAG: diguanylate cyclase [Oceanospirillaceae bacterium]|nr:diguanylate cyclase [Oceanospirillaceae bacterium]